MQDKVNPLCICGCGVENTCHFLLQGLNFLAERNTHVNRITSKGKYGPELTNILNQADAAITKALLYWQFAVLQCSQLNFECKYQLFSNI